MRIGLLTASVSRQAGGLFESVRGLGRHLTATRDAEVVAFGLNDSETKADLAAWDGVPLRTFPAWRPRLLGYAPGLAESLRAADLSLLHAHGLPSWDVGALGHEALSLEEANGQVAL
jgi:hypothetical protein